MIHHQKQNGLCMPLIFTECFCLSWFLLASAEQDTMLTGVSFASITWTFMCCRDNMEMMLAGRCKENGCSWLGSRQTQPHLSHVSEAGGASIIQKLCVVQFAFFFFFPWLDWSHISRSAGGAHLISVDCTKTDLTFQMKVLTQIIKLVKPLWVKQSTQRHANIKNK